MGGNGGHPPLVSVVIPTYNRWPLVRDAVESVLAQDFRDFEVVVVDDGSTDGTTQHLSGIHPAVRVVRTARRERVAARCCGVAEARGRYIAFLDSDDLYEPWHLSQFAEVQARHPEAHVFTAGQLLWDAAAGRTQTVAATAGAKGELYDAVLMGTPAPTSAIVVSQHALGVIGGLPDDPEISGGEDWVLFIRLVPRFPVFGLPRPSVRIRQHPAQSMHDPSQMLRAREAITQLFLREGFGGDPLSPEQRRKLLAGTHRFYYSQLYQAGDMPGARRHLQEVRHMVGRLTGLRSTARLWAQTWLGPQGSRAARRIKVFTTWQREGS